jgi:PAS domain-containing protein
MREQCSVSGFETLGQRKDRSAIWISVNARALYEGDELVGYEGMVQDVTERKRAEEALQYQLDLTRTITNNAADSLFLWDTEGRVTFMNPAGEQTFGWKQEELLGEVLHDRMHTSTRPAGRIQYQSVRW